MDGHVAARAGVLTPVSRASLFNEIVKLLKGVFRTFGIAGEMGDCRLEMLVRFFELGREDLGRWLDLSRLASDFSAPIVENLVFGFEHVRFAPAIPDRGVLGDDSQRHNIAATADQDREGRPDRPWFQFREAIDDDRHGAIEIAESRRRELRCNGHPTENLAVVQQIALNLLRRETTAKVGIAMKRPIAG